MKEQEILNKLLASVWLVNLPQTLEKSDFVKPDPHAITGKRISLLCNSTLGKLAEIFATLHDTEYPENPVTLLFTSKKNEITTVYKRLFNGGWSATIQKNQSTPILIECDPD
ncbi:MAG: hypothetical protein HY861_02025 [Chlamydiia bacterium]|nr:hypothetical protein [Chlamydiia bacterium]